MFIFRGPFRLAGSESLDPVQAELERRILFAPPGPLDPAKIPTYEQVRLELTRLDERGAASARALTLSEAGFGSGVRVVVVRDADGGIDRIEPSGKAVQPPSEGAEAEGFRPLGEADSDAETVDCGRKDTTDIMLPESVATDVEIIEVFEAENSPSTADFQVIPSFLVKSETSPQPQQKLQRPRRQSKPNPDSISETGLKPKTKPKADSICKAKATARAKSRIKAAAKAKANRKPKRERKKTIYPDERALAELCFFMAQALDCPFNMKADLNPGHLDRLDVEGRIAFCMKIVGNLRAYIRSRRNARGMPESWWPDVWGWVRESDPWTNLKEHVHLVFYAPEDERRRMVKSMEEKRKDPEAKKWCENAKFARIHPWEHWTGSKFKSALGYFVKMANPQDYHPDPTIWYKKSGFIAGPRIRFSPFLLDPDRVEAHRIDVQALEQLRDDDRAIMRRSGSAPAKNPRSLLRAAAAPTPAQADVQAEVVPVEVPATAAAAPVLAVVAPEPIEPAIYSGSGSPARVHHEAERRDMDLVEIETRPAAPAAIAPAFREPATGAPAMAEAHAEAVHPTAAVNPPAPAPIEPAPVFVTEPAAAPPPTIATADPIVLAMPASSPAEPTFASSSSNAVLAALAGVGRSVARRVVAGAGWISSQLGSRPAPPHTHPATAPPTPARRPRSPLSLASASSLAASFIAAGAFLGAPDIRGGPWA